MRTSNPAVAQDGGLLVGMFWGLLMSGAATLWITAVLVLVRAVSRAI